MEFSNFAAIVTKTSDVGEILFNGEPVTTQSTWSEVPKWGYSYVTFPVSHGAHVISVAEGSSSSAVFGAYAYGHSVIDSSTSAYGYTVAFEGTHHCC